VSYYEFFLGSNSANSRKKTAAQIIPSHHGLNGIGNSTSKRMSHHKRHPDGSLTSVLFPVSTVIHFHAANCFPIAH
jgi:hypothetical protein